MVLCRHGEVQTRAGQPASLSCTARITVRLTEYVKDKETGEFEPSDRAGATTTVGRALLSEILPKGLPFQQHQQGAQEEGNLQADQRVLPQVRPEGNRGVRRQAAAKRLPSGHARGLSPIAMDDMLVPTQKARRS